MPINIAQHRLCYVSGHLRRTYNLRKWLNLFGSRHSLPSGVNNGPSLLCSTIFSKDVHGSFVCSKHLCFEQWNNIFNHFFSNRCCFSDGSVILIWMNCMKSHKIHSKSRKIIIKKTSTDVRKTKSVKINPWRCQIKRSNRRQTMKKGPKETQLWCRYEFI